MTDQLIIYDTTLRDGEQAPGFSMNKDEKVLMAKQLIELGVDVIEAGFPAASQNEITAIQEIAAMSKKTAISALCRAFEGDIDLAWEAIRNARNPILHLFIPASDIQIEYQMKKTRDEILALAVSSLQYAQSFNCTVQFSAMDATRADRGFLMDLIGEAVLNGASIINLSDTTGYALPFEIESMVKGILQTVDGMKKILLSIHCHNDLGLAVANTMSAVSAGVGQVEVTVNGIGERAGNASLEEVVTILDVRKDIFKIDTGIDKDKIYETSRLLSEITGVAVHPYKPVVGLNNINKK